MSNYPFVWLYREFVKAVSTLYAGWDGQCSIVRIKTIQLTNQHTFSAYSHPIATDAINITNLEPKW